MFMNHPSTFIDKESLDIIRKYAAAGEELGRLHPEPLRLIYQHRWFQLFVPESHGGLGYSLPQALRVEEALAWADGSMGWTVTLCSGANWFIGFLDETSVKEIFNGEQACLAGSGRPSGKATVSGEGYEVNGSWNYATGAPQATVFTANCFIENEGKLVKNGDGSPLVRSFWFKREEVEIIPNWETIGMVATSSQGFRVKTLHVTSNRCFTINDQQTHLPQPIFRFPFLQLAETTLAINHSGMAVHFMDLCRQIYEEKGKQPLSGKEVLETFGKELLRADQELETARAVFYQAAETAWQELLLSGSIAHSLLETISHTSRQLAKLSRKLVDALFPYCGMTAANPDTEINRVWRDLHTASQHNLLL